MCAPGQGGTGEGVALAGHESKVSPGIADSSEDALGSHIESLSTVARPPAAVRSKAVAAFQCLGYSVRRSVLCADVGMIEPCMERAAVCSLLACCVPRVMVLQGTGCATPWEVLGRSRNTALRFLTYFLPAGRIVTELGWDL